jgi:acyl-CoA thioester hydrolase
MSEPVESRLRVRYAETDQMGVVYYGNYLTYFEVGRVEWCRAHGFSYRDMERDEGALLVVAEARCRYKAPARYDDLLCIRTSLKNARNSVVTFAYEVRREDGELLATGETVHFVTGTDFQPRPMPERYRALFGLE